MELKNITLRYQDRPVLDRFSLTLPDRGIVCLFGPSGCGKTSLLRVLAGLETPESGDISGMVPCSMVFQEDRLLPWLSAEKNITAVTGVSPAVAREYLALAGLEAEAKSLPASLSGGMRRRVAIVRALCMKRPLLLLDEPFQGLDEAAREALYSPIRDFAKTALVVMVTHHPEEAQALGAQVLTFSGPPMTLTAP